MEDDGGRKFMDFYRIPPFSSGAFELAKDREKCLGGGDCQENPRLGTGECCSKLV
jgi:hypothetical protein